MPVRKIGGSAPVITGEAPATADGGLPYRGAAVLINPDPSVSRPSAFRRPVPVPAEGRLSPLARVSLCAEILLAYVPLLRELRSNDVQRLVGMARARAVPAPPMRPEDATIVARRLAWIVQRVLGLLPTDNRCLIRSLVLLRMLEQRGIDATIVIGVQNCKGFQAHAWVEREAVPLLPQGDFAPLLKL